MFTPNFAGRRSQGRGFRRIQAEGNDDQDYNSPQFVVRSIASDRDDYNMLALTFRVWVIGSIICGLNGFFKARALFEEDTFDIPPVLVQFLSPFFGWLMAAVLPKKVIRVPCTRGFTFSLNPGTFNMKEHALITMFDFFGRVRPNMLHSISIARSYVHHEIHFWEALTMTFSSHFMCFLLVGLFLNWVQSPNMWWPSELSSVIFFRTWHEQSNGPQTGIPTRRFFMCTFFWSLVYQLIPGYFFPSIGALSFLCWVSKKSVVAQQIGGGINGLGLFSFSFDWSAMCDFAGDPLSTPRSTILNLMGGLLLLLNVVTPIINWTNAYETKRIPLSSTGMHDSLGLKYNVSRVMSADGITLNKKAYEDYSRVYFSALTVASYCFKVGSLSASLIYVAFSYKRLIWNRVEEDVHNRLMREYRPLSWRWFLSVFGIACSVGLIGCFLGLRPKTNLITLSILLLSCIVALVLVPPLGIFIATTGHVIPVELASRLLGGYIYPNAPFQGMIFDSFANQITINTVSILGTMKLGHYIKVDPKTTYTVVVAAMIISASVGFGETWYRTYPGKNSCSKDNLPTGSCPWLDVFYNTTYMWAFLGTDRILSEGNYDVLGLWFIVASAVTQVLLLILSRKWKFLQYINLPIILAVSSAMPPAMAAYMNSWLAVGIIFPFVAYKYFNNWTPANQFLLSVAISTGMGFTNSLLFASKGHFNRPEWWGSKFDDHCRLAKICASAPRIRVPGCP